LVSSLKVCLVIIKYFTLTKAKRHIVPSLKDTDFKVAI
jgi:hypothetical protein